MTMSARELGKLLVTCCREGREAELLDKHYSESVVSVEAAAMPGAASAETHGIDGVRGKHAWWAENFIVHDASVDGPFFHGDDRFGVIFDIDAEQKGGDRSRMKELAIYTVSDGKIVREEFFYAT